MEFGQPERLTLFWILVPVALAAAARFYMKLRMRRRLGRFEKLARISRIPRLYRDVVQSILLLAVIALAVAALSMPRLQRISYQPVYRGVDLVFLLDTSPSMGATDIQPSRLAKAREIIKEFLLHKENDDRAALVGFSDSSMIYSYLTYDPASLLFYFDYMDIGEESLYGTNIGAAIRSGIAAVTRERALNPNQTPRQTALILISDGDDHAGDVLGAMQLARQNGSRVYTIGIGSRQGSPIPVRIANRQQFLVNERGARLTSALHEETLKAIAASSGARYFRATSGDDLRAALTQILVQQRAIQGFRQRISSWDLYPYLLLSSFVLSLGLVVL